MGQGKCAKRLDSDPSHIQATAGGPETGTRTGTLQVLDYVAPRQKLVGSRGGGTGAYICL